MKKVYTTPKFYPVNPVQIAWDMLRGITENDRKYLKLFRYTDEVHSEEIPTRVFNRLVKLGFLKPAYVFNQVALTEFWALNKRSMNYE